MTCCLLSVSDIKIREADEHAEHLLQEQYWTHCEFFPHRPVPSALRKELNDTFRQARAGQLRRRVIPPLPLLTPAVQTN